MIERIIIENFKSIRKLDLELKPINILIGANGAGKSNFISFFKLSNRICEEKVQEFVGKNIDKFLYFGRKHSEHLVGRICFHNNFLFTYAMLILGDSNDFVVVSNGGFVTPQEIENLFQNIHTTIPVELTENKFIKTDNEEAYKEMSEKCLKTFKIFHFHDTGSSSPMKRINKLNDNRYLREDGENLAAYLYYIKEKHPKDFKKIELQIRSVAPFFDRFDLEPDRLDERQIELRWLEKGSDNSFDAYDLSDGTLRFMALTTLLMQPNLPKVIIIDEPELGLHPFAINKLAALIRQVAAKGTQVIVATQSVNFVDNFNPEDIIAVDREDNQSVFKRFNSEDLKEWLEDYTLGELWSKNLLGGMP
jgi:predicted ATPase